MVATPVSHLVDEAASATASGVTHRMCALGGHGGCEGEACGEGLAGHFSVCYWGARCKAQAGMLAGRGCHQRQEQEAKGGWHRLKVWMEGRKVSGTWRWRWCGKRSTMGSKDV